MQLSAFGTLAQTGQAGAVGLPMVIGDAEFAAGTSSRWFVIREPTQGDARAFEFSFQRDFTDVIVSSHSLIGGAVFDNSRYRLVELASPMAGDALMATGEAVEGVSVRPVVFGCAHDSNGVNDPFLANQYAIENFGQDIDGVSGAFGADVAVSRAWDLQIGAAQIQIAVIDSGVSASHPDLVTKLDEGVNVTGGSVTDTDAPFNTHGTHIAGIVAAATDNGVGISGISRGSRIVPVKAANILGYTSDVWLAEGLVWAADQGIDIAVMSFGLSARSDVLADAVRYATDRGVLVFASAGNDGVDEVRYPAAYPEVIGVGATDNFDEIAPFSNRGPEIDFVAPGVQIFSTRHTMFDPNTYGYDSGTSFSAPIVAGVAALMRSARPSLTLEETRAILSVTSRDLGIPGQDDIFGNGRVNAYRAMQMLLGLPWCYADINGDGIVSPLDFSMWVALYSSGDPRIDQNLDGSVEPADLNAFILNYVQSEGSCE